MDEKHVKELLDLVDNNVDLFNMMEEGISEYFRAEEAARLAAEEAERKRKEGWDQYDAIVLERIPDVLKPFVVPSFGRVEGEIDDLNRIARFEARVAIPRLAPISVVVTRYGLKLNDWKDPLYCVSRVEYSSEDYEPYYSFRYSGNQYLDPNLAIVNAGEVGIEFRDRYNYWEETMKKKREWRKQREDVTQVMTPTQELTEALEKYIRQVIYQRETEV